MTIRSAKLAFGASIALSSMIAMQSNAQTPSQSTVPVSTAKGVDVEEIIVSARRVEERLQDVPISITALNSNKLGSLNITGAESLARFVPGLIATSRYSPEQASFSIRGFTQELRTSASVGTYFADVVAPRGGGASVSGGDGAGPANLFDLQSIQVLKGPQGTLFGRNTTGGAILFIPNKPTDRLEGYVEGSYGNYDLMRLQGVINLPIADGIRLRVGVDRMKRDGTMKNISGIGPDAYSDIDYVAARASLAIDLSPDIENTTIGSFMESDHMPLGFQMIGFNPNLTGLADVAKAQVDRLNATPDRYDVDINLRNPRSYTRQWQVINTTAWQISDAVKLRNILSYSEILQDLRMNNFGSNFSRAAGTFVSTGLIFTADGEHINDQHNFTEELQLVGSGFGGRLNWQTGLYYEKSTPGSLVGSSGPSLRATCIDALFETADDLQCRGGSMNLSRGQVTFTNMAAYGQGTYDLTDQLKLTAGARYTFDRSIGLAIGQLRNFPAATAPFASAGPLVCEIGFSGDCTIRSRTSSRRVTWTLNLAYNLTPDVMAYGTWTRGYRQGAVNPFAAPTAQTFAPETISTYELGLKTSFRGAVSGVFNIAGYYNDLTNQQLQFALQPNAGFSGSSRTSIFNAGKSRIKGFEADTSLRFGEYFRVDGSINHLLTKLISIDVPTFPNYTIIPTADRGDVLPASPKWSGNIMGTFTVPVGDADSRVELSALYRYQSFYRVQAASVTPLVGTPVKQIDFTLNWRNVAGRPVDLQLFANNVAEQLTVTAVSGLQRSLGFDTRQLGEPRTFGARLKVRFGQD